MGFGNPTAANHCPTLQHPAAPPRCSAAAEIPSLGKLLEVGELCSGQNTLSPRGTNYPLSRAESPGSSLQRREGRGRAQHVAGKETQYTQTDLRGRGGSVEETLQGRDLTRAVLDTQIPDMDVYV